MQMGGKVKVKGGVVGRSSVEDPHSFFSDPGSYPGHGSLNANPVRTLVSYGIHSRWYNFRLLVYPKFRTYLRYVIKKHLSSSQEIFCLLANFIPYFVEFFT
jgi:hypothetical protein